MAQLEHPDNLARFKDPRGRLLLRILMSTGLRVGDGCKLALDCIVRDVHGAPYLHYTNHKMRRDAFVPIDTDLADAIARQQQAVLAELPSATFLLPRPTRNPDGHQPFSTATFRGELIEWLRDCDIRNELGKPVHVTPHQWRHTFGTRLINREVPQETVRRLLDHSSHQMTAHYARLADTTIREQWERARKVNINGQTLASDSGPMAEAVWMKNNLARAKMALPNGYCTLPLQQSCQYANACLTCPVFVTTAEFLPEHRRQLDATRALITQAGQRGQERVVEMNRTVETNLLAIITGLAAEQSCGDGCTAGCACTHATTKEEAPMLVDQIERLTAIARRRSEQTLQRAQDALTAMAARGDTVTVVSLAKNADVSRSWIYTQPQLRDRIEQLHHAAPARPPHSAAASRASLESLKRRLDLAHQRIAQLRDENQQLRRSVEQLHGRLRDLRPR